MAYISTEDVKKIRQTLKNHFDGKNDIKLKISTTGGGTSTLNVVIQEGKCDFQYYDYDRKEHRIVDTYHTVNHYHLHKNYATYPVTYYVLTKIMDLINSVKENSHDEDYYADYGPKYNYYINLKIGTYEKHYKKLM